MLYGASRLFAWALISALCVGALAGRSAGDEAKPQPAGPRTLRVVEQLTLPPQFLRTAQTLDPEEVVRTSLDGWMVKRGIPWGTQPDGRPTIRLSFDCRALPWPSIKQHSVDGPDNNMRSLAAFAAAREMLPQERSCSDSEDGIVAYLLGCTDPQLGLPYSPDSPVRQCAVGHGELTKNLILMWSSGAGDQYRVWSQKALAALRSLAVVESRPNVGEVAYYPVGMITPGESPPSGPDTPLGGWQHLAVGWNCWAFAQWHKATEDRESLDFAVCLANRLTHSTSADGDDGSLRPDGSFGGTSKESIASCHMHGHTHGLPGLVLLGEELIGAGRQKEGLAFIEQARRSFEWLYNPAKNPDAGSVTGWLGEWLVIRPGTDKLTDCEGCTMGDVVETAVLLGATARLDESLRSNADYYDRADEIFRNQCIEQMFTLRPDYLKALKTCLQKRLEKQARDEGGRHKPDATASSNRTTNIGEQRIVDQAELEQGYRDAVVVAEKMVGQQLGICGFGDWVNRLPSDLDAELPGIHMQGCCADATVRAAHAIWRETVTGDSDHAYVNMAFNRSTLLVEVVSSLPHRGEINVIVGKARKVSIRIPSWANRKEVVAYVDKVRVPTVLCDGYVEFTNLKPQQQLTATFPMRIAEIKETPGGLDGVQYTEKWRGPAIVDIEPRGKWIPLFVRPSLDTDQVP